VYLKFSTGNYSIAGKRGHWPASEDISLPYRYLILMRIPNVWVVVCQPQRNMYE